MSPGLFATCCLVVLITTMSCTVKKTQTFSDNYLLEEELEKLESLFTERDSLNVEVSKVDVAWHLDHSLKVINAISDSMKASKPQDYKLKPKLGWLYIFTFNQIPRGVAQSPSFTLPPDTILTEDLFEQLNRARENMNSFDELDSKSHFIHPLLGILNKRRTKKFLKIHTQHHISIIQDILN